ncbi:MAG: DUF5719 family protein [Acidimicrobiales bacterium]
MNRRIAVVVILVGAILAALVFDRADDDAGSESAAAVPDASVFPVVSDPDHLSSTWFCAGGTADEEAFADHVIQVANPTDTPVTVTLTAFAGVIAPPLETVQGEDLDEPLEEDGEAPETETTTEPEPETEVPDPVEAVYEVPAFTRQTVTLRDLLQAPVASALVEADAGGIVVEHEVTSVHGHDAKPCVTSAASTWHFAWGDTTVDARELLVLFNPFPDDAIVDGRFSTEDGARQPERFDGLVVPGRSTLAVDLGDDVTRREEIAATITARNGRIVVDRILRIDGDPDRGLTVQSGVPEPQGTWVYPDGFVSEAVREEYVVYNPTAELAEVEIEFVVENPEENGIPAPVDLSLAPGTHQVVDLGEDGRIPVDVAHAGIVRSVNGVPIVAERVQYSAGRGRRGISVTTGSPVEAEEWNFAAGAVTDDRDEWLVLVNLDAEILAEVDVTAVIGGQAVPLSGLQGLELAAGERRAIRLGEHISNRPDLALVVTSSEPIVAERSLYRLGDDERGITSAVGVPSPVGLRLPPDPLAASVDVGDAPQEDEEPEAGPGGAPVAPDDVELPSPDQTIVIDDPDAEAEERGSTTSEPTTTAAENSGGEDPTGEDPG